jgi:peptidoglycan/LPS O-acetylase OafA/YrhL
MRDIIFAILAAVIGACFRRFCLVQLLGIGLTVLGSTTMIGYLSEKPELYAPMPKYVAMAPTTAIAFIVSGISHFELGRRTKKKHRISDSN